MKNAVIALSLIILLGLIGSAHCLRKNLDIQRTISVQGTVTDIFNNPIPGAEIRIMNLDDSPALTDANGFYRMYRGINSGVIMVRISKPGYRSVTKTNIVVHADGPRMFIIDCVLESNP